MKKTIWLCLVLIFIAPALLQAAIIGPANIRFADGDVMFRTPDDDEWLPASINTPLDEGDAVWCPDDSRVEIQLPDGTLVRMDGGSQLDLLANEDGFVHLHLASGRLYLKTSQTSGNNSLQIDADDTTVLPAARTRLRIDMLPNGQEDVAIFKGSAYVEGNGSRTSVRAGEHIALEEGHNELLPLNPADNWEYWNLERDRTQSRSARINSYLPDELRGHAAELDTNGSWVRTTEYGTVWRPTVVLSDDWAPYRSGRWIWKGDDYVWISYESWGWVPYHFGRWAVVSGFGWCWVPPTRGDVYWGPGYVGWYNTGSQVGWTPLAPGEIFYGRRNYGRHSAIITNVNINPTKIVYRNRTNPGGLTVIQRDDFQRGRAVIQQPARNSSFSVSVSIGSPRIKPLRETRMPVIKETSTRVAPSRIEYRDNRELRERFPRVIKETGPERRRQQPAPVINVPTTPTSQTPVREKRTGAPVVVPNENKTVPGTRPHDVPEKRDEYRQRPAAPQVMPRTISPPASPSGPPQRREQPQRDNTRDSAPVITPPTRPQPEPAKREENRQRPTTPQPAPPLPSIVPEVSPQRPEQPRRGIPPQVTPPTQPQQQPRREEIRQRPIVPPQVPTPPAVIPQRTEQPKKAPVPVAVPREVAPRETKEKKVWKVTTPENSGEKDNKERDHKDKERR